MGSVAQIMNFRSNLSSNPTKYGYFFTLKTTAFMICIIIIEPKLNP